MAGDELDSDDSDHESDDKENDDDLDNSEDYLEETNSENQQRHVDEFRLKLQARAAVLQQNRPHHLVPQFGNSTQNSSSDLEPTSSRPDSARNKPAYPCQEEGCGKICKYLGGLTLHVNEMHRAKK